MAKQTVLFDFDGVIADSFSAAFGTAKRRCVHRTEEGYKQMFEANIYQKDRPQEVGDHANCEHDINWWDTFGALFAEQGGLFTGMDEVVRTVAKHHRLVIVSSCVSRIIESFLETQGLAHCFEGIYDAELHTSKSHKIGLIFEQFGVGPNDCVMITDTKGDILEAREKGVESIGVTWGFNSKEVLVSAEPWRIIELPVEIPNAVTDFFRGKTSSG